MSAAGGAFASGLGSGLIQLGTNYQQINQQDVENRAEALKQNRLEQMQIGTQAQQGLFQSAQLGMQEQQAATSAEQFKQTHDLARDQYTLAQSTHDLAVQTQKDTAAHQEGSLAVRKDELEVKRKDLEAQRKHQTDELTQRKTEHRANLKLKDKMFEHQKEMDKIDADIKQGNWKQAQDRWKSEKDWWEREFGQKLDEFKWDKKFKNKSFEEQKNQFEQNYKLKTREVDVIEARLKHEKLSDSEKRKLEARRITVQEELAKLDKERVGIEKTKVANDATYKKAVIDIDKRRVDLDGKRVSVLEAKQKFDEATGKAEQNRKRFKFTTQDVWGYVKTKEAVMVGDRVIEAAEYGYEKIGEKIVAINVSEPDINDVRILNKNGQWENGAHGMSTDMQTAFEMVQKVAKARGISIDEAYKVVKGSEAGKSLDWKTIDAVWAVKMPTAPAPPPASAPSVTTPGHPKTTDVKTNGQPVSIAAAKKGIITPNQSSGTPGADEVHVDSAAAAANRRSLVDQGPIEKGTPGVGDDPIEWKWVFNPYEQAEVRVPAHWTEEQIQAAFENDQRVVE